MSVLHISVYKCLEYSTKNTQNDVWNIVGAQKVVVAEEINKELYWEADK